MDTTPIPTNIEDQLKRDEQLRLFVYKDSEGYDTIGWGRNLQANGIRPDEAELMLKNDINEATQSVLRVLPWATQLSPQRFAVLVNMSFNMGIGGLLGFVKFLGYLKAGNYKSAAIDMLNSKWYKQVGARALRLSEQIELNEWR